MVHFFIGNGGNLAIADHVIDTSRLTNKNAKAPGSGIRHQLLLIRIFQYG